jgi:hypothetical protein
MIFERRIILVFLAIVLATLVTCPCLAAPASMSVPGAGAGGVSAAKTALISDYAKSATIAKQPAISGYGLPMKPDISLFTHDTTISTDPALILSWQQANSVVTPGKFSGTYGVFSPKRIPSCGCGC